MENKQQIQQLIELNERLKEFAQDITGLQQKVLAEIDKVQLQIDQLSGASRKPPPV